MWIQKEICLKPRPRGFHLISAELTGQLPELSRLSVGLMHLFIRHTSASLTVNECAASTVREDFEAFFNRAVLEGEPYYLHTCEGADDLPAHIKASILGSSLTIPVSGGRLNLGTWQGIYLCEHRNRGGARTLVVTLQGE